MNPKPSRSLHPRRFRSASRILGNSAAGLVASGALVFASAVHAATYNWIGTSSSFTTASNWVENAWTQWDDYQFGSAATSGTVNIDGFFGINSLTLQSGLTQDIVISSNVPNPLIMGAGVAGNPSALIAIDSASRNLTINSEYIAVGAVTWDVGAGRTLTQAGQFNNWFGAASIVKNGAGTAVLANANGYTGTTTINAGTLLVMSSTGLGAGGWSGSTLTTIHDGATLALQGGVSLDEHMHLMGAGVGGFGALRSISGNNALTMTYGNSGSGPGFAIDGDTTIGVDADTLTVTGFYHDSGSYGITKVGAGTLAFSQASTYTGSTTINGGKISNGAASGTSIALNGLTLNGGELAATSAPNFSLGNFYLNGDVTVGGGARSTISADLRVVSGQTRDFNVGATGDPSGVDLLISGKLGHQNNVAWGFATKSGAGTMKLSGDNEIGGMTVNAGRLILEDTAIGWTFPAQGLTNNSQLEFSVTSGARSYTAGIAGSGSLLKTGNGTMTLSGNNTYTGSTAINGGTLIAGAGGVARGAVTIASGATLSTTAASSTGLAALYYNNASVSQGDIASLPALLTHFGANSPTPSLVNTTTSMNFAGDGSGFPSPYNSGASNFEAFYSGMVNITAGGTYTFNTSSDDGSMLFIDGQAVVTNNFFQGVTTQTGSIALAAGMHDIVIAFNQGGGGYGLNAQMSGAGDTNMVDINTSNASITPDLVVGSLAGAGSVVLSTGNLITGIDGSSTTFSGVISGIGGVTKFGAGTLTLSGGNTNTGEFTIAGGHVRFANQSGAATSGSVELLSPGSFLIMDAANQFGPNAGLRFNSTGGHNEFALYGHDQTVASLASTNQFAVVQNSHGAFGTASASSTLTVNQTTDTTYTGIIRDNTGNDAFTLALVKAGAGKLTLATNTAHTGGTTVDGGVLEIAGSNGGNGFLRGTVTVNSGGELRYTGGDGSGFGFQTGNKIDTLNIVGGLVDSQTSAHFWNATLNMTGGELRVNGGVSDSGGQPIQWNNTSANTLASATTATISGRVNLRGDGGYGSAAFNVADGAASTDLLVSAAITESSGAVGITKTGAGTMTLTGNNTFTGTVNVNAGTLQLQGGAFSTTARDYSIASGAVLNLDGNTGVASGTTTLSGDGTLRVSGGTLENGTGPGRIINVNLGGGALIDIQAGGKIQNGGWQSMTWTNNLADMRVNGTFDVWDGNAVRVDALTGAGSVDKNHGGNSPTLLTVGVNDGGGTFSGTIANTAGQLAFTKAGTGTQGLSGANSYTGTTTISGRTLDVSGSLSGTTNIIVNSGGTLLLSGNGGTNANLNTAATMDLAGGTLRVSDTIGSTLDQTLGTLTLSASSVIDFGTFASGNTFRFADSASLSGSWSGTLSIYNWTDGADHLFFGNGSGTGLEPSQLAQIKFYSDAGSTVLPFAPGFSGFTGSFGEIVPVPEPSSVATVMGLLGLVGWRERRKAHRARRATQSPAN